MSPGEPRLTPSIDEPPSSPDKRAPSVTLREATLVWAKIGLISFGGPAGQIALMHRILVEEKRWIDETRFLHALNFCMLLPGPEAQQLATYVGWLLHRIRGGLIAGTLFILPGFLVILGLSFLYVTGGTLPLVQGLFLGLKAAVIVIVVQAVIRIGRRALRTTASVFIAVAAFLAMFAWRIPFPYVIVSAALAGTLFGRRASFAKDLTIESTVTEEPIYSEENAGVGYVIRCAAVFGTLWLAPTILLIGTLGPDNVFSNIGVFFSKMAVVTFGGAYAVLAYVSQEAVQTYQWLAPGEMIDGLAMAETTPGPLIMVTQFVGFVASYREPGTLAAETSALLGAALTTWVTFVPCFLWIFVGAPYVERLRQNRLLSHALSGVTAAVVGVILNLAVWFSIHATFSDVSLLQFAGATLDLPVPGTMRLPVLLITLVVAIIVFRFNVSVLTTLGTAGTLGIASVLL